jgi:hypothetical protein
VQLRKAISPMLVTPAGMVKEVSVFPAGYWIKEVFALLYNTPFSDAYALLAGLTFIAARLVQP